MAIRSFSDSDRTSETGDRTRRVILYSVQCCYAVHSTDKNDTNEETVVHTGRVRFSQQESE